MHAFKTVTLALSGLVLLAGCAFKTVVPGMSREEVLASYGKPTRVVPFNGGTRLQYSTQPSGQNAVMVDLDNTGKVVAAQEALKSSEFYKIGIGKWTRPDVELAFGPPALVDRVRSWPGDIMTYRWRDGSENMLFWVYLDSNNVVQRTGQGQDYSMEAPEPN